MSKKYALPAFLVGTVDQAAYQRWLEHKAQAHVRRDRKRGNARGNQGKRKKSGVKHGTCICE